MQLALPIQYLDTYKSSSQRARIATEGWGLQNLYCPGCSSDRLHGTPPNTPAVDYVCQSCNALFQMKSQSRQPLYRIVDAAYGAMRRAIEQDRTPNLFVVHYNREQWCVQSVILIPHFAFSLSAVEARKPLGATARRAGWIGCNILLDRIPADAKIAVVANGVPASASEVRSRYSRLQPIEKLDSRARGWTLDVLRIIRNLNKQTFSLEEVYSFQDTLSQLHPSNRHIREKIRQQLQVLRDLGFVHFLGGGRYQLF
jgi:type II restriction enzyme